MFQSKPLISFCFVLDMPSDESINVSGELCAFEREKNEMSSHQNKSQQSFTK